MAVEEITNNNGRESEFNNETFRESTRSRPEGGSGKRPAKGIRAGETQELWGAVHSLQHDVRDIRNSLELRDAGMETSLERMRSETMAEAKELRTRMEDLLAGVQAEFRDEIRTLQAKLETVADKLRTELADDIARWRGEMKADWRQLSDKLDWHRSECAREAKGSNHWSVATVIVAGFALVGMAVTVSTVLIRLIR